MPRLVSQTPKYRKHRCKLCGCCSGPSQKKWLNKLALASEECPVRPPRWGRYEEGLRRWLKHRQGFTLLVPCHRAFLDLIASRVGSAFYPQPAN
jgi:hypothetical protein